MIAVIDYGVGNLFSLCRSLEAVGQTPVVTGDPAVLRRADKLFLPGVGAFADAAEKLRRTGLDRVIREEAAQGKPILGICLGMQLLFEESREFGTWQGLGLLPGKVVPMEGVVPQAYKIPHIGWNGLHFPAGRRHPLLAGVEEGDCVYFVHSFYAAECDDIVTSNIFGDILSDEASQITGSIGMLPSASLAQGNFGMYEPVHGSAPDIAGQDKANPMATILSAAMMLRYTFGLGQEADAIENAVKSVLDQGYRTPDLFAGEGTLVGTAEMGRRIAEAI